MNSGCELSDEKKKQETHHCDDRPPSTKFYLVKRAVIIAEDLPQGVFAFTATLMLQRQKRRTVHTHMGNWPLKRDTQCEVGL